MTVKVVSVEHVENDGDFEDHTTIYATRVEGNYYIENGEKKTWGELLERAWQINGSDLRVYQSELDGYIALFEKLKGEPEYHG